MERLLSGQLAATLMLALLAGPCLAEDTQHRERLISEYAVRIASARLYSGILSRACTNGWRYPRSQIEKGFRRHFEELHLLLVDQGYTIMPVVTVNKPRLVLSEMAFDAYRRLGMPRQFGCFLPYWLD
jgi:hypothetical protein